MENLKLLWAPVYVLIGVVDREVNLEWVGFCVLRDIFLRNEIHVAHHH
jgi:hypothetical protein